MYINAHDHLTSYKDLGQSLEIIEREKILTLANSMNPEDYLEIQKIRQNRPLIKKGLGIHPWEVGPHTNLDTFMALVPHCDFIGEIGLDFHWAKDKALYPKQEEIFQAILVLAKDQKKICNIHTKGAEAQVLHYLKKHQMTGQIIHWYSGPLDLVQDYLALGSYFTISCDVGHSPVTDLLIDRLPLDRILTETDGPQSLEWINGTYGQADYVKEVLAYISRRKKVPLQTLEKQVEKNYRTLMTP